MPRRWYWDWQANIIAQQYIKMPQKYMQAKSQLQKERATVRQNILSQNRIPDITLPRNDIKRLGENSEEIVAEMKDSNASGSVDDELPTIGDGFAVKIRFEEELAVLADGNVIYTPTFNSGDLLDLNIIKRNNGGNYIEYDENNKRIRYSRVRLSHCYAEEVLALLEDAPNFVRE